MLCSSFSAPVCSNLAHLSGVFIQSSNCIAWIQAVFFLVHLTFYYEINLPKLCFPSRVTLQFENLSLCTGFLQLWRVMATLWLCSRGFSLWCLLAEHRLQSAGSEAVGHGLSCLWYVGSSRPRNQTGVPCTGRQILIHCITRGVLIGPNCVSWTPKEMVHGNKSSVVKDSWEVGFPPLLTLPHT